MTRRSLSLLPAAAVLLCAVAARAEEPTKVAVLPYAPIFGKAAQSDGDKTAELVVTELKQNPAFEVVPVVEGGSKKGGEAKSRLVDVDAAAASIKEATEAFEKAAELVKKRKMKPGAEAYEKAIDQYLKSLAGAESLKPVSDALVSLATTYFKLDAQDKGTAALERLVRVDPDRILEPPEVVNLLATLHQKARKQILGGGRGSLRIDSNPAGAEVFVDTRKLGETPLIVSELLPGEHFVRVTKEGLGSTFEKILVSADDTAAYVAPLAGDATGPLAVVSRAIGANKLDEAAIDALVTIGKASKADYLVFGGLLRGSESIDVRTFAFAPKDKGTLELGAVMFDLEMLGAQIEIYKVVSEFAEKTADFTGTAPVLPMRVIGADAGEEAVAAAEPRTVRMTADRGDGKAVAASEDEGERSPRRGPVVKKREEPATEDKPAVAAEEKKEEEPAEEAKPRRKIRERKKIGEPDPEEQKPEEKKEEDTGGLRLGQTTGGSSSGPTAESESARSDALAAAAREQEEAERKKAEEERAKTVTLSAVPAGPGSSTSSLSPEELARIDAIERDRQKNVSRTDWGAVALWGGVGAVVLGGLITGGVLIASPSTPTAARPVVTWSP